MFIGILKVTLLDLKFMLVILGAGDTGLDKVLFK